MKRLLKWDSRRLGGKKGFTLIELLIVMVILAILAGIVIISIGGVIGRGQETAYNAESESLQTAVLSYYASNNSTWPTSEDTNGVGNDGLAGVIDMCILTVAVDPALPYLDEAPGSAHGDNYGTSCAAPATPGHYLWMVGTDGNVYSECVDAVAGDCTCSGDGAYDPLVKECEGWQDVYP